MGSATRTALEGARAALASAKASTAAGEQLLAASRALAGSPQLRSVLADPGVPVSEKSELLSRLLPGLDPTAASLLGALVDARWSDPSQLVDGIEEIGIRAIAKAAGPGAALERELFAFERAVASDHELELALAGKLGDPAAKGALVERLLTGKAQDATVSILRHLVQSPRGRRIGELVRRAADLVADEAGGVVATVTTAAPLGEAQLRQLTASLAAQYGRAPRIRTLIDPDVVGGLRVQVGDEVVDGTIASRFAELRQRLAG